MERKITCFIFWLCLIIAPLILVCIELFHPAHFTHHEGMFQYLSHSELHQFHRHGAIDYFGPSWWFLLHMIQTPCIVLLTIGLCYLTKNIHDKHGNFILVLTWICRLAIIIFVTYYTVLDSIGGIGLGRLLEITKELQFNPQQLNAIQHLLNTFWTDSWVGGMGSFVSLTGSWAILIASILLAIILFACKRTNILQFILLIGFGCSLFISHASLYGPIAFTLLTIHNLYLWFRNHDFIY